MGFVGETTAHVLEKKHTIIPYDKFKKQYENINKEDLIQYKIIFIYVPIPMKENGE